MLPSAPALAHTQIAIRTVGDHSLLRFDDDTCILVGPDNFTDLDWVVEALPAGAWDLGGFETFGDVLVTSFVLRP